jgi:hypothetical protein
MSDNLRRYIAIESQLKQLLPSEPQGNFARHLRTLALCVSGLVGARKAHLPAIASKAPGASSPKGGKRESRVKRLERWLRNKEVTPEAFFAPYAQALLASLPPGPLALVMDGSEVGRGCLALMLSVAHRGRALPLCWLVVKGKKGHFPTEKHIALLRQARGLVPPGRQVVFLGDGEFDSPSLLAALTEAGWDYVCRTARNTLLCEADWPGGEFVLWDLVADGLLRPGGAVELAEVGFTGKRFGPVLVAAVWESGQAEPLFLVSSLDFLEEARAWYKRRFAIETLFCDQKSRGFHLSHSHLSDPVRLSRLMIATCLAYYWMVCLGAQVKDGGQVGQIHRRSRCDLSLFQIGLVWLDHCLNEGLPILVPLTLTQQANVKSVRL